MEEGQDQQALQDKLRTRIILSLALAVLVYLAFLVWSDWRSFLLAMESFPLWLLLPTLALAFTNYLTRYVKFDIYLKLLDIHVSRWLGLKIFLAGLAGTVTPGKLGEVLKSVFLKRDAGAPVSRTAPIVVAERFTDLLALLLLTTVGLKDIKGGWPTVAAGFGLIALMVLLVSWQGFVRRVLQWLQVREGWLATLGERLSTAYDSTRVLLAGRNIPLATAISVLSWSCECLGFFLVLWGFGIEVTLAQATFVYCFSTLFGALVMLPGGIGPTEASLAGFLVGLGAPRAQAVASTLIIRACTLWFAVFVGALALAILGRQAAKAADVT